MVVIIRRGALNVHSIVLDICFSLHQRIYVSHSFVLYIPSTTLWTKLHSGMQSRTHYGNAIESLDDFIFILCMVSYFIKIFGKLEGISLERRHFLILDEHTSHVTFKVVHKAKSTGLDFITLPSYTSHALQPLDVIVFKPFKQKLRAYRDYWCIKN